MNRFLKNIALALLFLCLTMTGSASAYALDVIQVRFGLHNEKTRMVLDLSDVSDFRVFALSDPYRMVIDLPGFNWKAGSVVKPPQTGISDVRQGPLQPGISRIVFDMKNAVSVKSAFLLPAQNEKSNRLVIDFTSASPQEFAADKGKIFGTLRVSDDTAPGQETTLAGSPANDLLGIDSPPIPPRKSFGKKPLIIIDPGHGGIDPGAPGPSNLREKDVVLALGLELKKQLLATGRYRVMMTRDKDEFIRLADRVKFARNNSGDLFVSIHADSVHKANIRGASVYTLSQKASDAQTAKLAEKENKADLIAGIDLSTEDEQVANILYDFAMTDTMNQSKFFANTLVDRMKSGGVSTLDNTHRYAGFAVLKAPDIPSILIESGFMSNASEARMLNQTNYRSKMASSIRSGIDAYFEHVRLTQNN
ncbi:MAG: N-acetylmuramoyl-L-alanine amidase [Alphaproteobacteria bacterium]|nr:N-acetylmuramoyl-L-alanine amidase [Alphaproteobacteria bacterium]